MWKGRFEKETSTDLVAFGESISFDRRLYRQDIAGSIAHARALVGVGVLDQSEFEQIETGLRQIESEIDVGNFEFKVELEDIHMNIESELTSRIGPAGAKLHTSRSRNDQVALDTRMYCRDAIAEIDHALEGLQRALLFQAEANPEAVLPGYTHLQRGQPVLYGHHLLAYVEMISRDRERLQDAFKRVNHMPLGSGALAGSTICVDRMAVAKELGFDCVTQNSMDAVSDRDYVAEILFDLSLVGVHLSRLGEDLILWCSAEFGFARLSDAHTTGSSLMPQKKNPDIAELARGKSGRLVGNLVSLLVTLKGLPMTYNRDLQEDKEPLFDSIDTALASLGLMAEMIHDMEILPEAMAKAASDEMLLATDIADYLVRKGVPFRESHDVVGSLTAYSLREQVPYSQIPLAKLLEFSEAFSDDVYDVIKIDGALAARKGIGAPSPDNLQHQLGRWRDILDAS